ncbi:hypothetical protein G9A89_002832 [Geosiphon pyriformis]|nr:hypothetical protein G9A89_002832 [Geosiphon pyriformis]
MNLKMKYQIFSTISYQFKKPTSENNQLAYHSLSCSKIKMLDELIPYCVEEIALDGEQGANFSRLWKYIIGFLRSLKKSVGTTSITERQGANSLKEPDDAFKQYFWKFFVHCVDIDFGKLPQNGNSTEPLENTPAQIKRGPGKEPIPELLNIVDVKSMSLQQLISKYGDSFVMIAKPKLRRDALFSGQDTSRRLTPIVYEILQLIGRRRALGATQNELAKIFEIDPRSVYHYLKTLLDYKLIVKMPVVTQGTYTNLCILARCAEDNEAYTGKTVYLPKDSQNSSDKSTNQSNDGVSFNSDLIRMRMTQILAQAKNQIMLATDLMKALGMSNPCPKKRRWFNRTIGSLQRKGYIEKVNVTQKGSKSVDRCVKLVKLYEKTKKKEGLIKAKQKLRSLRKLKKPMTNMPPLSEKSSETILNSKKSCPKISPITEKLSSTIPLASEKPPDSAQPSRKRPKGLLSNIPLEYQIYHMIEASGDKGIIPAQLHRALNRINGRILYKILNRLSKPTHKALSHFAVKRISEFQGRERHYRYFSYQAYKNFAIKHGLIEPDSQEAKDLEGSNQEGVDPLATVLTLLEKGQENKNEDYLVPRRKKVTEKRGTPHKNLKNSSIVESSVKKTFSTIEKNVDSVDLDQNTRETPSSLNESVPIPKKRGRPLKNSQKERPSKKQKVECPMIGSSKDAVEQILPNDLIASNSKEMQTEPKDVPKNSGEEETNSFRPARQVPSIQPVLPAKRSRPISTSEVHKLSQMNTDNGVARLSFERDNDSFEQNLCVTATDTNSDYHPSKRVRFAKVQSSEQGISHAIESNQEPTEILLSSSNNCHHENLNDVPGKVSAKRLNKQVSKLQPSFNSVIRGKILLQLLEERKILECNNDLVNEVKMREDQTLQKLSRYTIDKKTLARIAENMQKDQKLKMYKPELQTLKGNCNTRILFLHKSLTESSRETGEYVAKMRDKAILNGGTYKTITIDQTNVELESLQEMKKRVASQTNKESRPDSGATVDPLIDYAVDDDASCSMDINSKNTDRDNEMWWLDTAQDYGYINAKMIRAKLLHEFIIQKIQKASYDDKWIIPKKKIFQTVMLLSGLSLDLYLKLIGLTMANQNLSDYINSGQDMTLNVFDLPIELRSCGIFPGNSKLRQNIKRLIDILVALKILRPIARNFDKYGNECFDIDDQMGSSSELSISKSSGLSPAYQLLNHVRIVDYSVPGSTKSLIRECFLDTREDVERYWHELQYISLQKASDEARLFPKANHSNNEGDQAELTSDSSNPTDGDPKPKINSSASQRDESDPLRNINNPRNWLPTYPLTSLKKKILESYVNRKNGQTPYGDDLHCRQIAQEVGIPFQRVKAYFKRVLDAYEKKYQDKLAKKTRREKESRIRVTAKSHGILASKDGILVLKKKRNVRNSYGAKSVPTNAQKVDEIPVVAQEENLPIITDEDLIQTQYETTTLRKRPNWTLEEDELIIHAYAILRHRSQKARRFLWAAATKVLPSRTNEMCRRRINVLFNNPMKQERFNNLLAHWEKIYPEALSKGEIIDDDESDMIDFDLPGHIQYFMNYMSNRPNIPDPIKTFSLPLDIGDFDKLFEVTRSPEILKKPLFFEDKLVGLSLRAKMRLLYAHAFTCRLNYTENDFPQIGKRQNNQSELLQALFKMILMTPDDQYVTSHAYFILNNHYSDKIVNRTLEKVNETGAMVKVKRGQDRRIPGRGYYFSNKFRKILCGTLPDGLFKQAAAYLERTKQEHEFSEFADSGTMACILDLLVQKKLTLCETSLPPVIKQTSIPNHKSRNVDLATLNFTVILKPKMDFPVFASRSTDNDVNDDHYSKHPKKARPEISEEIQADNKNNPVASKKIKVQELPGRGSKRINLNTSDFLDEKDTRKVLLELFASQDSKSKAGIKIVYKIILNSGKLGVSLISLKASLKENSFDIDDSLLTRYVTILESNEPKLIVKVGYNSPRYVCSFYGYYWLVKISPNVYKPSTVQKPQREAPQNFEQITEYQSNSVNMSKLFAPPRMWYDINGEFIDAVFHACLEAVLGTVLQKPGIYQSNIHRKLRLVMSSCEIDDCLEELIKRNAISRLRILKPPKVTAFSEPGYFEICDDKRIDAQVISTYEANTGYYETLGI